MEEVISQTNNRNYKIGLIFVLALIITLTGYFISPFSNVKTIRIINNTFLSKEYILQLSSLTTKTKFLFVFPDIRERIIAKDNLINNVEITLEKNRTVTIIVNENKILGYQVDNQDQSISNNLILSDGTITKLEPAKLESIALLPLFIDISQENRMIIAKQLKNVDISILSRISEISLTSFTYDNNMVKLTSDDGYIIYCPMTYLEQLNSYFEIIKNDSKSARCILFMDDLSSALITDCKNLDKYQKVSNDGE